MGVGRKSLATAVSATGANLPISFQKEDAQQKCARFDPPQSLIVMSSSNVMLDSKECSARELL